MKTFLILITFIASLPVLAGAISQSVILSKVEDGSGKWENKVIFSFLEKHQKNLSAWSSKQKLAYPNFDNDLLYYKMTFDEQYEYHIYFDYVRNECLYETVEREVMKAQAYCRTDMLNCIKDETPNSSNATSCFNKSSNCLKSKSKNNTEKIEKKYCEKLYGRGL